jgi:hypothetical protein
VLAQPDPGTSAGKEMVVRIPFKTKRMIRFPFSRHDLGISSCKKNVLIVDLNGNITTKSPRAQQDAQMQLT